MNKAVPAPKVDRGNTPATAPLAPPAGAKLGKRPVPAKDPNDVLESLRKARLRELIAKEGGYGGAALIARKAGRTQADINHKSRPGYSFGERSARQLEADLGLPHMYFDAPEAPAGAGQAVRLVPIMDWARVGRHPAGPDTPTVATAWAVGPRAVAVVARGTMWAGDGVPGVPAGWHAIVDPDASQREGDLLCCWLPGASEATLRQYLMDGGTPYLYPVDRRQTNVVEWTRDVFIVGPVIGCAKLFR